MNRVARQKIVDKDGNLYAYELLYRGGELDLLDNDNGDKLTLDVLINSLFNIGLARLADNVKVFINFANSELMVNVSDSLSPHSVGFEILENVSVDEAFVNEVIDVKRKGFTIALDDFSPKMISDERIYKHIDIIKVDFLNTSVKQRERAEEIAREFPITLLAEKIETSSEYDYAINNGYSLMQGYYIDKPEIMNAVM